MESKKMYNKNSSLSIIIHITVHESTRTLTETFHEYFVEDFHEFQDALGCLKSFFRFVLLLQNRSYINR